MYDKTERTEAVNLLKFKKKQQQNNKNNKTAISNIIIIIFSIVMWKLLLFSHHVRQNRTNWSSQSFKITQNYQKSLNY